MHSSYYHSESTVDSECTDSDDCPRGFTTQIVFKLDQSDKSPTKMVDFDKSPKKNISKQKFERKTAKQKRGQKLTRNVTDHEQMIGMRMKKNIRRNKVKKRTPLSIKNTKIRRIQTEQLHSKCLSNHVSVHHHGHNNHHDSNHVVTDVVHGYDTHTDSNSLNSGNSHNTDGTHSHQKSNKSTPIINKKKKNKRCENKKIKSAKKHKNRKKNRSKNQNVIHKMLKEQNCMIYIENFEKYDINDRKLEYLEERHWKLLIPQMGPRRRCTNYINSNLFMKQINVKQAIDKDFHINSKEYYSIEQLQKYHKIIESQKKNNNNLESHTQKNISDFLMKLDCKWLVDNFKKEKIRYSDLGLLREEDFDLLIQSPNGIGLRKKKWIKNSIIAYFNCEQIQTSGKIY